jgi:type I restriction enzyme S subunit
VPDYYGTAIEWIQSDNINTPHYYLTRADEGLSEAVILVDVDPHILHVQLLVGKRLIQQASTSGMKGMVNKSRFEGVTLISPPVRYSGNSHGD